LSILLYNKLDNADRWRAAFQEVLPDLPMVTRETMGEPGEIRYAVVWQPEPGVLGELPNLRAIFNLGAGVDGILRDASLPADIPIVRLRDAGMATQITEYALYGTLHYHRDFDRYAGFQRAADWTELPNRRAGDRPVGVMGLGVLGADVAAKLAMLGFDVSGWSRSPKTLPDVSCFHGDDGVQAFLSRCEILIVALPLTDDTRGFLDARRIAWLPDGAALVNLARGPLVVEADLLAALEGGKLRGALLDVFNEEPLPADNPLWRHPKVIVTPHIAAQTRVREGAAQIAAEIRRMEEGGAPSQTVDRSLGY